MNWKIIKTVVLLIGGSLIIGIAGMVTHTPPWICTILGVIWGTICYQIVGSELS